MLRREKGKVWICESRCGDVSHTPEQKRGHDQDVGIAERERAQKE